jgi:hypothetical protein
MKRRAAHRDVRRMRVVQNQGAEVLPTEARSRINRVTWTRAFKVTLLRGPQKKLEC